MKIKFWQENKIEGQFSKAHPEDAGFDIRADLKGAERIIIAPAQSGLVTTGLHVQIPRGYVGIVKSRSGIAVNNGIEVGAGVIDSGYTGEVKVLLHGFMDSTGLEVRHGQKIAQMVVLPISDMEPEEVASLEDLGVSERGQNGFGSTGN